MIKDVRQSKLNLAGGQPCVNLSPIHQGKLEGDEINEQRQISQIDQDKVD